MSTTHQHQTYPLLADQLSDIEALVRSLNYADKAQENVPNSRDWGSGFRAVVRGPIPVVSDATGTTEYLGWLVRGDHEWTFTQIHPTGYSEPIAES